MSFRGIVRSQALYEHINPSAFDTVISIYTLSTAKNALGEDVRTYTLAGTQRALVVKIDASGEDIEGQTNKTLKAVIKLWTWYHIAVLNNTNQIGIDGVMYDIVDSEPVYGRKRFVTAKLIQYI